MEKQQTDQTLQNKLWTGKLGNPIRIVQELLQQKQTFSLLPSRYYGTAALLQYAQVPGIGEVAGGIRVMAVFDRLACWLMMNDGLNAMDKYIQVMA
jgi:hypothetical protein